MGHKEPKGSKATGAQLASLQRDIPMPWELAYGGAPFQYKSHPVTPL